MSLPIPARNAIKKAIQTQMDMLINYEAKPAEQAQRRWKYKNASDWHYGHFVGMMEALAISSFSTLFGQNPNAGQMREIAEIIQEYTKDLRDYFQSFDEDQSSSG